MNLNGVTNGVSSYQDNKHANNSTDKKHVDNKASSHEVAAIYEPSVEASTNSSKKTYKPDTATIDQLKADAERHTQQLRNLVEKLLLEQGEKITEATDIYSLLREGKVKVDPETAAQAQKDIAEDGYWGVKQTSERMFSFAKALTGGDPSKAKEMKEAFIKGYEDAKKAWGGQLPEISQKTYDATIALFDDWMGNTTE